MGPHEKINAHTDEATKAEIIDETKEELSEIEKEVEEKKQKDEVSENTNEAPEKQVVEKQVVEKQDQAVNIVRKEVVKDYIDEVSLYNKKQILALLKDSYKDGNERKSRTEIKSSINYSYVVLVQAAMKLLGNPELVVDGIYGEKTKKAVQAFEATHKLTVDKGWAGPKVFAKIEEVILRDGDGDKDPELKDPELVITPDKMLIDRIKPPVVDKGNIIESFDDTPLDGNLIDPKKGKPPVVNEGNIIETFDDKPLDGNLIDPSIVSPTKIEKNTYSHDLQDYLDNPDLFKIFDSNVATGVLEPWKYSLRGSQGRRAEREVSMGNMFLKINYHNQLFSDSKVANALDEFFSKVEGKNPVFYAYALHRAMAGGGTSENIVAKCFEKAKENKVLGETFDTFGKPGNKDLFYWIAEEFGGVIEDIKVGRKYVLDLYNNGDKKEEFKSFLLNSGRYKIFVGEFATNEKLKNDLGLVYENGQWSENQNNQENTERRYTSNV